MSEDLIKRSDAIDAIELVDWYHQNRNKDMVHGANSDEHQAWYKSQDIYEALENVPSAEKLQDDEFKNFDREALILLIECQKERIGELLADRPQGEWTKHDEERDYCSACKHIFKTRALTKQDKWTTYVDDLGYNYCPNCGARMKGADDDR